MLEPVGGCSVRSGRSTALLRNAIWLRHRRATQVTTRYRDWVRTEVPRPTERQMRHFAIWLSDHHSWYKKLPLDGVGEPFFVSIAPNTHRVWVESESASGGWRDFIRNPNPTWAGDRLTVSLRSGDREPDLPGPPTQAADGMTTAEVWTEMSRFSYWNFGPPGQPAGQAVAAASAGLRALDDTAQEIAIPEAGLWRGLIYLRGTISPTLGPREDDYEALRDEHGLPSHAEDRQSQLDAVVAALFAFTAWVYE